MRDLWLLALPRSLIILISQFNDSSSPGILPEVSSISFDFSDPSKRYSISLVSETSDLFGSFEPLTASLSLPLLLCGICTTLFLRFSAYSLPLSAYSALDLGCSKLSLELTISP